MPIIEFICYSIFKRVTGEKRILMKVGSTVKEAIDDLIKRFGKEMNDILLDSTGSIKRNLIFSLNGIDVRKLKGFNTPLKSGDSISLVYVVAGGSTTKDSKEV